MNHIEVSPIVVRILKNTLAELKDDRQFFICNSLTSPRNLISFGKEDTERVRLFIMAAIEERPTECTSIGGTLFGWIMANYKPFDDINYTLARGISHEARKAWVSKLLYLIEEKKAITLFTDGAWMTKTGLYEANGNLVF